MKWTIVIIWFVSSSNFQVPKVGHGYYWFDTEAECEQHLLKDVTQFEDVKAYSDDFGLVIEAPWIEGVYFRRCQLFKLP